MTATPAPAVPAPEPVPEIDVESEVAETLASLPTLDKVRDDLELLFRLDAIYGSAQMDRKKALQEVLLFHQKSPEEIESSIKRVAECLAGVKGDLETEFTEKTGANLRKRAARFEEETREQQDLMSQAENLLAQVANLCGALNIQNPDPGLGIKPKRTLRDKLVEKGIKSGVLEKPAMKKVELGWLTEPHLDANSDDVHRLNSIIDRMISLKDPAKVKAVLKGLKFDDIALADLFRRLTQVAREQIDISSEILAKARQDFADFDQRSNAISAVMDLLGRISNFFFPEAKKA